MRVRAILFDGDAHEIVKQRLVGGAFHGRAGALLKPLQADAVNERACLSAPLEEQTHNKKRR